MGEGATRRRGEERRGDSEESAKGEGRREKGHRHPPQNREGDFATRDICAQKLRTQNF